MKSKVSVVSPMVSSKELGLSPEVMWGAVIGGWMAEGQRLCQYQLKVMQELDNGGCKKEAVVKLKRHFKRMLKLFGSHANMVLALHRENEAKTM